MSHSIIQRVSRKNYLWQFILLYHLKVLKEYRKDTSEELFFYNTTRLQPLQQSCFRLHFLHVHFLGKFSDLWEICLITYGKSRSCILAVKLSNQ